jgi:hypothetical protein
MKISNGLPLNIFHHRICPAGGNSPIRTFLVVVIIIIIVVVVVDDDYLLDKY